LHDYIEVDRVAVVIGSPDGMQSGRLSLGPVM